MDFADGFMLGTLFGVLATIAGKLITVAWTVTRKRIQQHRRPKTTEQSGGSPQQP